MLRSVTADWYFEYWVDFDRKIDVAEYTELVRHAAALSFPIVASVCDQGGGNDGLKGRLGVSPEKPYCEIELADGKTQKVFFLHDFTHIFKGNDISMRHFHFFRYLF